MFLSCSFKGEIGIQPPQRAAHKSTESDIRDTRLPVREGDHLPIHYGRGRGQIPPESHG